MRRLKRVRFGPGVTLTGWALLSGIGLIVGGKADLATGLLTTAGAVMILYSIQVSQRKRNAQQDDRNSGENEDVL